MSRETEIGNAKRARRVFSFDEIAVIPARRTRDPEMVSTAWSIDAYQFELPFLGAPMDSIMSPQTVIELGKLGGLGVLNLEGLWTRYENPEKIFEELAAIDDEREAIQKMREFYAAPIQPDLIRERITQIREADVCVAASLSPHRTVEYYETVVQAGVDLFVIRGNTVSAEHVSVDGKEPLNLKQFIYELDVPVIVGGAATYQSALHLMRTGAAGVLVGFGGGASSVTRTALGIRAPMATAVADVAGARRDYLDESGGRYVHVIADGGLGTSGDVVKAIACGADAVMLGSLLARAEEAPGAGWHWGQEAYHPELLSGKRVYTGSTAELKQIIAGPAATADGTENIAGALRKAIATTGFSDLKSFQRVDLVHTNL